MQKLKNILLILVALIVVPIHILVWYIPVKYLASDKMDWLISPKDLWEDITWDIFHEEIEVSGE